MAHERGAVIPGRVAAALGDVVAGESGDRDRDDLGDVELRGEGGVVTQDAVEHFVGEIHQVHFVDGEDDVFYADQRHEIRVAAGLREYAAARVYQDDCEVRGGRAGDHVARVLFVAGRVGHDELALVRGEEAVGDVDRDALFALGGQAIDQQREIDVLALRAHLLRVGFEGGELVLEDHLAVVEQAADQRGFAVIHAAAGDEAEQGLGFVLLEVGAYVGGDQVADVGHVACSVRKKESSSFLKKRTKKLLLPVGR